MTKKSERYYVGQVIGGRTILEIFARRDSKRRWCRARCVCGKEHEVSTRSLRRAESCGCLNRPQPGEVFGARTVVESKPGAIRVRCVCGKEQVFDGRYNLNNSYSCGCTRPPPGMGVYQRSQEQKVRRTDTHCYLLDLVRKRAAVRQGELECSLAPEDFEIPAVCPERGVALKRGGQRTADSPTVVLLDPSRGYIPGNIRVISWAAAEEARLQRLAEEKAAAEMAIELAQRAEQEALKIERRERFTKKFAEELKRSVYDTKISTLPCSVRLDRALQRLNVETVMDLMSFGPNHFLEQPNVGRLTVKELKNIMKALGVVWPNPIASWLSAQVSTEEE